MAFVAVDVETANADWASICQIGLAVFNDDGVQETWTSLVNPEDYFDATNVSIHGITEADVEGRPAFPDLYPEISGRLSDTIVVHHMPFDRVALRRAARRYDLPGLDAQWIDSAKVARRTWDEYAHRGYGLANLAQALDIPLNHHDALSDAIASGTILCRAVQASGLGIGDWIARSRQPIAGPIARSGQPDGPLVGERVVFTGEMSIPRREAAELAAAAGCDVANSLSRSVTRVLPR